MRVITLYRLMSPFTTDCLMVLVFADYITYRLVSCLIMVCRSLLMLWYEGCRVYNVGHLVLIIIFLKLSNLLSAVCFRDED